MSEAEKAIDKVLEGAVPVSVLMYYYYDRPSKGLDEAKNKYRHEQEAQIQSVVKYFRDHRGEQVDMMPSKGFEFILKVPSKEIAMQISKMLRNKAMKHRAKFDKKTNYLAVTTS